jgi:tetratricopeptide (TPR) repeat protein
VNPTPSRFLPCTTPSGRGLRALLAGLAVPLLIAVPAVVPQAAAADAGKTEAVRVEAQPDTAEWLARARLLEKRRDWPGLLLLGMHWTRADPDHPLAWFVLGRAHQELRQHAEAIAAYQRNLRLDPGDFHARNNLGNVLRESLRHRDALLAYREAVRANPRYFPAWQNMGRTYYVLKGQAGIFDAVEQVRRVNPDLARAWYSLVLSYYRGREDDASREALEYLSRLSPAEVDQLFTLLLERLH